MPTFTDASLVAAGTGALLWAVLAAEASARRRTWAGLAGFVALEAAAFALYTDIVVLGCAVAAAVVAWRLRAARVTAAMLAWWLGSVAVFGVGAVVFDDLVYGGPLRQGYRPGEITFSLGAIGPNLRYMPAHLIQAMPMLVLGLAALAWIGWRWVRLRRAAGTGAELPAVARRDAAVGLALAASWLAVWGLHAAYTWTARPVVSTLQAARFYVPVLGAISLLGAWLVTRVPGRGVADHGGIGRRHCGDVRLGVRSFHQMTASRLGPARIIHGCPGQHQAARRGRRRYLPPPAMAGQPGSQATRIQGSGVARNRPQAHPCRQATRTSEPGSVPSIGSPAGPAPPLPRLRPHTRPLPAPMPAGTEFPVRVRLRQPFTDWACRHIGGSSRGAPGKVTLFDRRRAGIRVRVRAAGAGEAVRGRYLLWRRAADCISRR